MTATACWLLDLGGDLQAAVGIREMIHLLEHPTLVRLPLTPPHCQQLLDWEGQPLPVWDLAAYLLEEPTPSPDLLGIVTYPTAQSWGYGALSLARPPKQIPVVEGPSVDLPDTSARWQDVAIACLEHQDQAIPILDLAYLFSSALAGSGHQLS